MDYLILFQPFFVATKQRSTLAELMSKPSLVNEGALDTSSGEGNLAGQASVHEGNVNSFLSMYIIFKSGIQN